MQQFIKSLTSARLIALLIAICATSGAWAAAGDDIIITNVGQSTRQSAGNLAATDTYTLTFPTASLSSGYVRLKSFAYGMNSRDDSCNATYVTCVDFLGNTVISGPVNGNGQKQATTKLENNALKQTLAFGSAGESSECIVKAGVSNTFGMQDGNGTNVLQRVYMINTTNGDYSPVVQSTSSTSYRTTQELVATVMASVSTAAGGNWSELSWENVPADWTAATTAPVLVIVTDDCTITLDTAVSAESIIFAVTSGKTLTLAGANTLTAANGIIVKGGSVVVPAASTFSGTVKGNGTLVYETTPSGLTLNDSNWSGVLWLKNCNIVGLVPGNVTSANSTLRLTGVKGYFNDSGTVAKNPQSTDGTLDLQDDGSTKAFTVDNGWSDNGIAVFGKLTGSGSLVCTTRDISQRYVFKNPSAFTGTINCERTDSAGHFYLRVVLGDGASLAPRSGTITVVSDATATVAAGKIWNAWAINVNGTLNVGNGSTIPAINTGSTGTIIAYGSGAATISGVKDNAISAKLAMVGMNLAVSDTSITELTIPADTTLATQTFSAQNGGKLDLSACTSLTTLKLALGSSTTFDLGNVILPASCTTVTYVVDGGSLRNLSAYTSPTGLESLTWTSEFTLTETREEYANGTFSVANVPANATVTVTRPDDTSTAATVTDGTARLSDYGTVKISGAATVLDISYTNTFTIVYNKVSASSGHDGMWTSPAQNPTYNNVANDETTGMYIKWHPYMSSTGSKISEFQDHLTLAAVGTMSPTANRIFLHLGSSSGSNKGILILTGKNKDEVYIAYNSGKTITLITTTPMTVPNAATARHAYIVTKEDADDVTTFTVYLDGIKWKTTSFPAVTLGTSTEIQVGSDISGSIKNDASGTYKAVDINADTATETGVVNTIRLYDRIITSAEIAEYAAVYPYVSPNGSSSRTFTAAAENWIDTTESSEVWSNSDDTKTGTPLAGASLNVTAGVATEVTINLASETYYEALTIGGAATTFKAGTADIKVTGMTVIGTTVTNEYGAVDMTGGPMTITEDGDITFDYSSYDISDIYTTTDIPLTSDVDENSTKVHLVAPSAAYRTVSLVYKSGYYAMRVAPNHENGAEVYFKSGYLASNMNGTDCGTVYVDSAFTTQTVMFPNDKMVINDNSDLTNGKVWIKDDFVGNIRISRTSAMSLLNGGDASGAILDGVTITVDSGSTLNISKNDVEALNIGAATINGDGSVNIPSATTVSGAVSGTAALTISGTVNVASGGSIANAVAGTGTIAYAAIPAATPSSFTGWTGTVELPSFSASSGVNFNNYGTTGSTVALAGMTEGYILEVGRTVAPTLRLDGAMNITAMSSWTYTFAEITGTGNLSFPTSENSPNVTITKVAEGYSGTISSTLETPVTITTLAKAGGTSTASGTKLLSKSGNVVVDGTGTVTIGGEAQTLTLYYADDGVYVDGKVSSEGEGSSAVTTVTTDTETTSVSINLGDGYEGSVVVPPNVESVTTTGTSLATDKVIVKYGTTDISGAFTVGGSAGAITLALNANGSVTISDKTITVKPAVDTSDDPMTMPDETTAPAFNIKTIPGLWYVVRSGTSPSSLAAGDATQATTTTTGLAGPALSNEESVRYYTISVGRTAAEAAE
ncbi:MAG: hypothetical protein IKO64_00460 [Kiritimatiellae bacterium]|nr:hypothetical protein [Kiritimatiellia bacterium]